MRSSIPRGVSLLAGAIAGFLFADGWLATGGLALTVAILCRGLAAGGTRASADASPVGGVLDDAVARYVDIWTLGGLCLFFRSNSTMLGLTLLVMMGVLLLAYAETKALGLDVRDREKRVPYAEGALLILAATLVVTRSLEGSLGSALAYRLPALVLASVGVATHVAAIARLRDVAARATAKAPRPVRDAAADRGRPRASVARRVLRTFGVGVALVAIPRPTAADAAAPLNIDAQQLRFVESKSGPVNYYTVASDPSGEAYVHAAYQPPDRTAVLGYELPDADRGSARLLRWRWRALELPKEGDECAAGREDSAAVVYVLWRHELRYYTLKFVWSSVGTRGAVCGRKRNLLLAQDTVILETGGPLNTWENEEIDLRAEFRRHFADGRADASVPPLVGIGVMSDGDQTASPSVADYGRFSVVP